MVKVTPTRNTSAIGRTSVAELPSQTESIQGVETLRLTKYTMERIAESTELSIARRLSRCVSLSSINWLARANSGTKAASIRRRKANNNRLATSTRPLASEPNL